MNEKNQNMVLGLVALLIVIVLGVLASKIYQITINDPSKLEASDEPGAQSEDLLEPVEITESVDPISNEVLMNCTGNTNMEDNACSSALEAINRRYPALDLGQIEWISILSATQCDSNEIVEAQFSYNDEEIEAEFSPTGSLLEIEYERVPVSDLRLPDIVKQAVQQDHPNFSRSNFELEISPTEEKLFEFQITNSDSDIDATYDVAGNSVELNRCED